jgi:SAM-dependent methyltransferase
MTDITDTQRHWSGVWADKVPEGTSWFQESPEPCSRLVRSVSTPESRVALVGVGASLLVADLLAHGYRSLEALDISAEALARLRGRLGADAARVRFHRADARTVDLEKPVDVWHDRATFHFLTRSADRAAYVASATRGVAPGGHVVVAAFAMDGPEQCSGLPVTRYDGRSLAAAFGDRFELIGTVDREHVTPWGSLQPFVYAVLRRSGEPLNN